MANGQSRCKFLNVMRNHVVKYYYFSVLTTLNVKVMGLGSGSATLSLHKVPLTNYFGGSGLSTHIPESIINGEATYSVPNLSGYGIFFLRFNPNHNLPVTITYNTELYTLQSTPASSTSTNLRPNSRSIRHRSPHVPGSSLSHQPSPANSRSSRS